MSLLDNLDELFDDPARCQLETCGAEIDGKPFTFTDYGKGIKMEFCSLECCEYWRHML